MTPGIILLLIIWVCLVFKSVKFTWIGVIGYAGFAILCPPWNWRWGLPEIDYQKFLALGTLIGWFMAGVQRQTLTKTASQTVLATAVYVGLAWISSLQSINPVKTAIYMDVTTKIAIMCGVGVYVLREPRHLVVFAWVLMIAQGWNALGVNQVYYQRGFINVLYFSWNYLDNNTYSISTVPIMAISFAILVTTTSYRNRLISGVILILQMHQIMLLQSRGTMLGSIGMVVLGLFFMPKNRVTCSIAAAGFLAGAILAGPSVVEEFSSSFKSDGERDSSAESRFLLWKAGAAIMSDYPLLGVGPWAGELLVPRYFEGDLMGMTNKALHNLFFEVGTGCGIPGAIAYVSIFLLPWFAHLRIWLRERRELPEWMRMANLAVLCGIPGYWAASMFSSGALIESPYMLALLATAALPVYEFSEAEETEDEEDELSEEDTDIQVVPHFPTLSPSGGYSR